MPIGRHWVRVIRVYELETCLAELGIAGLIRVKADEAVLSVRPIHNQTVQVFRHQGRCHSHRHITS